MIFFAFILLIADFAGRRLLKVPKPKNKYLPLVMKGTQLQDKKIKRRPFFYSVVRYLVLLNGFTFLSFILTVIVISSYDPKFTLNPFLGIIFDVFFYLYFFGLISPTYRDFKWLTYGYNLILNEIDKEDDIYLRIHLDYPGASASLPLEGELVQIQPKIIIKASEADSNWYETVHWKQIKRISIRLVKRSAKQPINIGPDFQKN